MISALPFGAVGGIAPAAPAVAAAAEKGRGVYGIG